MFNQKIIILFFITFFLHLFAAEDSETLLWHGQRLEINHKFKALVGVVRSPLAYVGSDMFDLQKSYH